MRPEERTLGLLWDMQDYARVALEIGNALTLERLRASRYDQLALSKALEVVGEAASQLPDGFTALHPEIPWHDIVNLRHRIVHDYRNIDFRILWDIVENELPSLIRWLDGQLAAAPPGGAEAES